MRVVQTSLDDFVNPNSIHVHVHSASPNQGENEWVNGEVESIVNIWYVAESVNPSVQQKGHDSLSGHCFSLDRTNSSFAVSASPLSQWRPIGLTHSSHWPPEGKNGQVHRAHKSVHTMPLCLHHCISCEILWFELPSRTEWKWWKKWRKKKKKKKSFWSVNFRTQPSNATKVSK